MTIFYFAALSLLYSQITYTECHCRTRPLFREATVTASSSLSLRKPIFASLDSELSWTAFVTDSQQYLDFEFNNWQVIDEIITRGYSNDFVSKYVVSYGSNGRDYLTYRTSSGHPQIFSANTDSSSLKQNTFDVPIIARWIRIYPIRWTNTISMKVELYGCDYDANQLHFNGRSFINWNLLEFPINSESNKISLRIKTEKADGVILYSRGTLGDYLALQLHDNKMELNVNLGSGDQTTLSVGSSLDDDVWHDVSISHENKAISLSVDRITIHKNATDDFSRLNLDKFIHIGGILALQNGLDVFKNFTGCIDNLVVNSVNIGKELKHVLDVNDKYRMQLHQRQNIQFYCQILSHTPVTFLSKASFVKLPGYENRNIFDVAFHFKTFAESGLLMYHGFRDGYVKMYLSDNGKMIIELETLGNPRVKFQNFDKSFNDGRWYELSLHIASNTLLLMIDEEQIVTNRLITVVTGPSIYLGGGVFNSEGFLGCMKEIVINGIPIDPLGWKLNEDYFFENQIAFDACQITDRCNPNPCEHGGICSQSWTDFKCDCSKTNYVGSICHKPKLPRSCESFKLLNDVSQMENIDIDVDGSGPLEPFPVTCQFHGNGMIVTELHHKNEKSVTVDGHQIPGSFVQDIKYLASSDQIEVLISQSVECWQYLRYDCFRSRLLNSPSSEDNFQPFSWWVSRNNQKMDFWGGAPPGSRKCACAIQGTCKNLTNNLWCNCDAGHYEWRSDGGDIRGKEYLPVKQLRFGDTGTLYDDKKGKYFLGPMKCILNDIRDNVVTFRRADATISLSKIDFGETTDIFFEFKTAISDAVLIDAVEYGNKFRVELRDGNKIFVQYDLNGRLITASKNNDVLLTNVEWHSVYIEINVNEIYISLDGRETAPRSLEEPLSSLKLVSSLTIGGSAAGQNPNGFVGCVRAFTLNGKMIDLMAPVRRNPYGLSLGCVGKCDSNPCLNNGLCNEYYDSYSCDCRWTSFKGPICADDIGIALKGNSMVKYKFTNGDRSTISENIRVGFTTTHSQGFLVGFFSNLSSEYLTISLTNGGHLRIVFDFGFERQELIYGKRNFALGQYHDLRLTRKDSGSSVWLQVDRLEPEAFRFHIRKSADAQFDKIQYLYIGKNESMDRGFVGCISRVEFDDIYPLKLLFQQNPPKNVKSFPPNVLEDFCGVEPITYPPEGIELRPSLDLDDDKVLNAYHRTNVALVSLTLIALFILSVAVSFFLGRYISNRRAQYHTQEQLGADAADADTAVMYSKTGCRVRKKREWFL